MSEFKQHWDWAASRGKFQQDYNELEHVYNLMKACDCQSYLEVGSAEGNSLYILGSIPHAVSYIDIGEKHTDGLRADAISKLRENEMHFEPGKVVRIKDIKEFIGDSTDPNTYKMRQSHDCILIDGGHDFATVLSDSILYAPLATKYIFWHDIQLPEVRAAVEWFMCRWKLGKYTTFINSPTYGYGICEVGK